MPLPTAARQAARSTRAAPLRRGAGLLGAAALAATLLGPAPADPAAAAGCPDSALVFARGSGEPAGLGNVGQAFAAALQSRLAGHSVEINPVDYPASHDYRPSASAGTADASGRIQAVIANCPATKLVLGGYSQGAAVIELSTATLPADTADHVAAVVLFGAPRSGYASNLWGGPLPVVAPAYQSKSVDLCVPDDIVCADSGNMAAHLMYVQAGMTEEGAGFAADRL